MADDGWSEGLTGHGDPISAGLHLLGAIVCLWMCCLVWRGSTLRRRPVTLRGQGYLLAYLICATTLLTASGLYHLTPRGEELRSGLQRLDHAGIFVLIAGTHTAAHGLCFRGIWQWGVIALSWTVAVVGVVAKLLFFESISEGLGLVLYLAMGWLGLLTLGKLASQGRWKGVAFVFAGGCVYTLGAVWEFFGSSSPEMVPTVFGPHEVFHIAVLGGVATFWRFFLSEAKTVHHLDS